MSARIVDIVPRLKSSRSRGPSRQRGGTRPHRAVVLAFVPATVAERPAESPAEASGQPADVPMRPQPDPLAGFDAAAYVAASAG